MSGKPTSYWRSEEGKVEQAIRAGLRDAGVQGPLAFIVGPVLRAVMQEIREQRQDPMSAGGDQAQEAV
jgi:hypothetical protein